MKQIIATIEDGDLTAVLKSIMPFVHGIDIQNVSEEAD